MKITNPATGKVIKEIESDSPDSVKMKFKAAKGAQLKWSKIDPKERKAVLENFRSLLGTHEDELAETLTSETAKPITQSHNEIKATPARVQFFIDHFEECLRTEEVYDEKGSLSEEISWDPLGVIANISAWNYPYFVGTNVFVPALLTGNSVLYKPSEFSSLTGLAIANLLYQAGVPKDVFIPVIGDGSVGSALLAEPINGLFFTGSRQTGMRISEALSGRLIRTQFELGGKDPTYVDREVEINAAAEGLADGAFYNNGQSCCSVERIYVHEEIADEFTEAFLETVKGFKAGDPMSPDTYLGPLTRPQQLEVLDEQIKDAIDQGATLLCGGKRRDAFSYEATVFSNVTNKMKIMRDESFGPVIGIQTVKDESEAVSLMNDTDYGLTAGVFSKNRETAIRILGQIHSGSVYWNCCDRVSPRLPWTGRRDSGLGSTLSKIGIRAFQQPKAWHLRSP